MPFRGGGLEGLAPHPVLHISSQFAEKFATLKKKLVIDHHGEHTHTYIHMQRRERSRFLFHRRILKAHFLDGPQLLPLAAMSQRKEYMHHEKQGPCCIEENNS